MSGLFNSRTNYYWLFTQDDSLRAFQLRFLEIKIKFKHNVLLQEQQQRFYVIERFLQSIGNKSIRTIVLAQNQHVMIHTLTY